MGLTQRRRTIHIWLERGGQKWRVRYESYSAIVGFVGIEWAFDARKDAFDHARQIWEIWQRPAGETTCSNG
ncbi:hypothetical protein [Burkholderia cenocepacia]|uniref:hypothetical protein n=1 Tax=Burkholderia cenocepacia TaxID=95486 RepID=UPI001C0BB391|nr:hypothetical protein [Burkholderia cenocepacia]